ncbi:tubulin epsilon and delta complex protein 2 isoform X4 [Peromyscus californicus insignis]|uniref:tubulin epsilon and delta complex protein 2 isoform X4 n=1 Tax=Peromyscus californicus insignis TaxID=564181 RepID=UPI0022A685C7|nr:tubulin epsilon and delta complex protein 2 isoform X4 [Peromyscus californicus insignis]
MRWSALWSKSCSLRSRLGSLAGSGRPSTRKVRDSVAAAKMLGARADCLLPTDCSRRLVAEVQGALDSCAERQRQLERSLRVSRRLLQVWEPARTPAPEPETKEEAPTPACTTSAQDLKELELLTQALEKAVRVRKGMSKAGQRDRTPSLTSASNAATSGATAPAHSQAPSRAGSRASGARSTSGIQRATVPAKDYPECRLLSRGDRAHVRTGTQATRSGPGLRDQQMAPSAVPPATELFTLKEKGTLLQLPVAFRKAASQNSRLWAQLSSIEGSDSADATRAAKTQFLHKLQVAPPLTGCRSTDACSSWKDCGPWLGSVSTGYRHCKQELQTLATLKLRVAMLDQQIHLEKVLMAELLPLINTQEPRGPPWLALCRAAYSLLCEGGFYRLRGLVHTCNPTTGEPEARGS